MNFASGENPCRYDGASGVTRVGVPPVTGMHVDDRAALVLRIVVADPELLAVERQHVIVVVARRESRVDHRWLARLQIEAIEPAAAVVDQRLAVGRPVRRLNRTGLGVKHRAIARRDVHHLQVAADVVAIRRPAGLRRNHDAHVAEDRLLRHLRIVRTHEQTDIDVVAEIHIGHFRSRERLAELRDRHDELAAGPFELDDVRRLGRRFRLLRDAALRAAELERCQAVAVDGRVDVGGFRVERLAHDPPELPMRIDALAEKRRVRAHDEVAGELPPRELELVARAPHVHAGAGDRVGLRLRIVDRRPGDRGIADVLVRLEVADLRLTGSGDLMRRRGLRG